MAPKELLDYIKQTLSQGFTENQIKEKLLAIGWQAEDINAGFTEINNSLPQKSTSPSIQTPVQTQKINPASFYNSSPIEISKPIIKKSKLPIIIISGIAVLVIAGATAYAYTQKLWFFAPKIEQPATATKQKPQSLLEQKINEAVALYKTQNPTSTEQDIENFKTTTRNQAQRAFEEFISGCKNFPDTAPIIAITSSTVPSTSTVYEFIVPGYGLAGNLFGGESCLYKKSADNQTWQKINSVEDMLAYTEGVMAEGKKIKTCQDLPKEYISGEFGWDKEKLNYQDYTQEIPDKTVWLISVAPSNPKEIYATVREDCLYKSMDGGINWQRVEINTSDVFQQDFKWLLIDPVDSNHIFGFGGASGFYNVMIESKNGGVNWKPLIIDSLPVSNIELDSKGKKVIAITTNEIPGYFSTTTKKLVPPVYEKNKYKSNDDGKTWTKIENDELKILDANNQPAKQCSIIYKKDAKQVAHCSSEIYASLNKGITWEKIYDSSKQITSVNFDVEFINDEIIYIKYRESGESDDLAYISKDFGKTWAKKIVGFLIASDIQWLPSNNKHLFAISFNYLYESKDSGYTWQKITKTPEFLLSFKVNKPINTILLGGETGIRKIPIPH